MRWSEVLDRYIEHLPLEDKKNIVSLKRRNTPLIRARRVEKAAGEGVKE